MSPRLLFVTGTGRSGTTLVDKLLWSIPGVDSFSQPLPLLFVELKRRFLRAQGREIEGVPPLSDQQFANHYDPPALGEFLGGLDLEADWLRDVLAAQISYTGQYFKPADPFASLAGWTRGSLIAFAEAYFGAHGQKRDAPWVAFKETFAEEFIPSWLDAGARALLVLRDPRDVLLSVSHGASAAHAGLPRPLLFVARQWRKSALYALGMSHEGFRTVRYEDVTGDPSRHRAGWADWLGVSVEGAPPTDDLKGQDGADWTANSSFRTASGVFATGVGRYRTHLPDRERRLIEALCFAEMRALGYAPGIDMSEVPGLLAQGWADEPLHRPALASYRLAGARLDEERERWNRVVADTAAYSPEMFIFERAYAAVRDATGRSP